MINFTTMINNMFRKRTVEALKAAYKHYVTEGRTLHDKTMCAELIGFIVGYCGLDDDGETMKYIAGDENA